MNAKKIIQSLSLAAMVSGVIFGLAPSLWAQQADQDPTPTAPRPLNSTAQQSPANGAPMPASGAATTRPAEVFSGRIVEENGEWVLQDPVTKVIRKLDDPAKAKRYLGKFVKITGKLDTNTNTIQIENVQLAQK
jgi:hypothetical protein